MMKKDKIIINENEVTIEELGNLIGFTDNVSDLAELKKKIIELQESNNNTLVTDLYELTMSDTYLDIAKKDDIAYFDIFYRTNAFNGGYMISGGLDECINYIKNFHFTDSDIDYLRSTGKFNEDLLLYLKDLKFTGDVYAIPDGTPIFPNEPVLTVRAPLIEAQILETALLTAYNTGSLTTTASKRITNAAGNIPVMEFGARRVRGGIAASVEESKYAFVGGCKSTSNTMAGKKYNIPVAGTQAHSSIQEFDSEEEAFLAYAKRTPNKNECVFLVDTYDTLKSGIPNAIKVSKEYLEPNGYRLKGIRIDSGDITYLTKVARVMLDEAGMEDAIICVSNSLDEYKITSYLSQGAKIDSFGIGDNIVAPKERANFVYKLVAVEKDGVIIPKIKISGDTIKVTNPGFKKVVRFYDYDTDKVLGDVICGFDEVIPLDGYTLVSDKKPWERLNLTDYRIKTLQVPIFRNGKLVYEMPSLKERQEYCASSFETLTDRITDIENPHEYYVDLSEMVRNQKEYLIYDEQEKASRCAKEFRGFQKKIGVKK